MESTLSLICLMVMPQAMEMKSLAGVNDSASLRGCSSSVSRISGYKSAQPARNAPSRPAQ